MPEWMIQERAAQCSTNKIVLVDQTSDKARLIGRVAGVGPDAVCSGLRFGDLVELTRWVAGVEHGWFKSPLDAVNGAFDNRPYRVTDESGLLAIEADPREMWVTVQPDQILYRICSMSEPPGFHPVADRLYLRHQGWPEKSSGGVDLSHLRRQKNPLAQVVEMGPEADLDDFEVGDWVVVADGARATWITDRESGETYSMVRAGDVELNYRNDPPGTVAIQRLERVA